MLADTHGFTPDMPPPPLDALLDEGFTILRSVAPEATVRRAATDLSRHFEATPFCQGGFYGGRTKRFGRLLSRSDVVADLVLNPEILGLAERTLLPWCDTLQLNLSQAIEIYPGAPQQFPHRDQKRGYNEKGRIFASRLAHP